MRAVLPAVHLATHISNVASDLSVLSGRRDDAMVDMVCRDADSNVYSLQLPFRATQEKPPALQPGPNMNPGQPQQLGGPPPLGAPPLGPPPPVGIPPPRMAGLPPGAPPPPMPPRPMAPPPQVCASNRTCPHSFQRFLSTFMLLLLLVTIHLQRQGQKCYDLVLNISSVSGL